jgi:hypothetical protein
VKNNQEVKRQTRLPKKLRLDVALSISFPSDKDKAVLTKLLESCYKYSLAMNEHFQEHPFPSEALITALLLEQHKLIDKLVDDAIKKQIRRGLKILARLVNI